MDQQTLNQIKRKVKAMESERKDFLAYDDMDECKWELPPEFIKHEWIRKHVSTAAHDILKNATDTYDFYLPRFDIQPRGIGDEEAELYERFLEWLWLRASQNGKLFREGIRSSAKYGKICLQIDYLRYTDPNNMGDSSFCDTVHKPHDIVYQKNKTGLSWVAALSVQCADDVMAHWESYLEEEKKGILETIKSLITDKKKIKSGIDKIKSDYLKDADEETYVLVIDYTSKKKREVLVIDLGETESYKAEDIDIKDAITIVDEENKLGIIPWAIAEGVSDPLLAPLLKGGSWENENFIKTMRDSSVIKSAFYPFGIEQSPTGEWMTWDFTGTEVTLKSRGASFTPLQARPLDPAIGTLSALNENEMRTSVGVQNLAQLDPTNVQASVFNNQISLQLVKLLPYKKTFDECFAEASKIKLQWIKASGKTETAYRTITKDPNNPSMLKGAEITFDGKDFDPTQMYITCDLRPNQYTDKLQKINGIAQMKQAGMPMDYIQALEDLGDPHPEATIAKWEEQEIAGAELAATKQKSLAEVRIWEQSQILQLQQQMQQAQIAQQTQGQAAQPSPNGFPGGPGNAPPQGGNSPYESNPNATQTVMQGQGNAQP